jgi:hypothetical protein
LNATFKKTKLAELAASEIEMYLHNRLKRRVDVHNVQPKPFAWTQSVGDILNSVAGYCRKLNDLGH